MLIGSYQNDTTRFRGPTPAAAAAPPPPPRPPCNLDKGGAVNELFFPVTSRGDAEVFLLRHPARQDSSAQT